MPGKSGKMFSRKQWAWAFATGQSWARGAAHRTKGAFKRLPLRSRKGRSKKRR